MARHVHLALVLSLVACSQHQQLGISPDASDPAHPDGAPIAGDTAEAPGAAILVSLPGAVAPQCPAGSPIPVGVGCCMLGSLFVVPGQTCYLSAGVLFPASDSYAVSAAVQEADGYGDWSVQLFSPTASPSPQSPGTITTNAPATYADSAVVVAIALTDTAVPADSATTPPFAVVTVTSSAGQTGVGSVSLRVSPVTTPTTEWR